MNISHYSNICRTCLSETISMKPVSSVEQIMDTQIALCDMLMALASVTIFEDDGLPSNICLHCTGELRKAYTFKKMCESSENALRKCSNIITPPTTQIDTNFECTEIKLGNNVFEENIKLDDDIVNSSNNENPLNYKQCDSGNGNDSTEEVLQEENIEANLDVQENNRKKKSYSCEECKEECFGLAAYWKHMANIHGQNYKCEHCDKEFKTQNLLIQHKSVHDKEVKEDKTIARPSRNKTGITKQRNLPRTCDICNKTFRFHSNLERHKLIHTGERPFLCNVCGKGFGQMSYLKIHSFIHTGEKPYKCQMCDKSFAAPGTLMTHIRIHTGERPHVCKICGKDFPQSGYLSAHIRTHTGEKPVECKVCHRRFNQSGRLVIHMRIHSGEKPYPCKECGRSFAVKGTLKKHIRTHTGERPYVCSVCGQAFAQSGTLATHMKVHRPKI